MIGLTVFNSKKYKLVSSSPTGGGGGFSTTSTSFVDVANLTLSYSPTGLLPLLLWLEGDNSGNNFVKVSATTVTSTQMNLKFIRDSTDVRRISHGLSGASGNLATYLPPSAYWAIDYPTAGTYTYKVAVQCQFGTGTETINISTGIYLNAMEIGP